MSVALISPTHTFLAFLGDSPIATIDFKDRLTIAFKNHDYKNEKERVKAANAWFCASGSKERNRLGLGGTKHTCFDISIRFERFWSNRGL